MLELPPDVKKQIMFERAGLVKPADGGCPDAERAADVERELQRMDRDLSILFATRGPHAGRWCFYYNGPLGLQLVEVLQDQETYEYTAPDTTLVHALRDCQADPDHYERLMREEYARKEREADRAATEWSEEIAERAEWGGRLLKGDTSRAFIEEAA